MGELGAIYGGLTGKGKADFGVGEGIYLPYTSVYNKLAADFSDALPVRIISGERQNEVKRGDVLFTASSETPYDVGMTSVVTDEPPRVCYLNSFCFGFRFRDEAVFEPGFTKFLFRTSEVRRRISRCANGVTRYNLSKTALLHIPIPLPPLAEQRRIAGILDEFDALTTSLTDGLPAEIEARRKQYAYWRDKLLAFPEKPAA